MRHIRILNKYIIWHLFLATSVVSLILIGIVFLTQSIRFLELVVETGASGGAFWFLTFLALPRFFEVIVPIAVMISVLFIYHRLMSDSELVVMKSAGLSSSDLARPAILFIIMVVVFLYSMSFWIGPKSAAAMQHYRQVIKANAGQFFFREGVFNTLGDGLMIYIRQKNNDGELRGLMIHDRQESLKDPTIPPVTIMAERGVIVSSPDHQGNLDRQVVVYDGQRQQYNSQSRILDRLAFERYTIEIPEQKKEIRQRWAEPDERTLYQLLFPKDLADIPNAKNRADLRRVLIAEANRRITGPLLSLCFGVVSLAFLLTGPMMRGGYANRIIAAAMAGIVLQSLYLISFNFAKDHYAGNLLMAGLVTFPALGGYYYLSVYNRHLSSGRKVKKERGHA